MPGRSNSNSSSDGFTKMLCKNKCVLELNGIGGRLGSRTNLNGKKVSLYNEGYIYCGGCEKFMKKHTPGYHCLCCGRKVRFRPANTKRHHDAGLLQAHRY